MSVCNCNGKCKVWSFTCSGTKVGDIKWCSSSITLVDPIKYEIDALRGLVTAQEHSINVMKAENAAICDLIKKDEKEFDKRVKKLEWIAGDLYIKNERIKIQEKEQKPYQNIFDFIAVGPKGRDDIRHIKNVLYEFYVWILDNVPDNEYRSKGIGLLEDAAMQLNKAISRRKDNGT
jgi:hypothetical protein